MAIFDFITAREFRASLEADYAEMSRCADTKSWKSVHVLAGSIVESLLVDYLAASKNPNRPKKDPLKLDLSEAISTCLSENVLSQRTADLCSVIRSYRNLIHPGRVVRLNEPQPSESSATVALTLVDMISEDLANVLRKTSGLTGEQIISKVLRDSNSLTILSHLLVEVSDIQKERLLIELIPAEHDTAQAPDAFWTDDDMTRLEKAYRMIVESSPSDLREKVAMKFVNIIRDADGARVLRYGKAFFVPADLKFLPEPQRRLVIDHFLATVRAPYNIAELNRIRGIEEFIRPEDVTKWLDPFIQTLYSANTKDAVKNIARARLIDATSVLPTAVDGAIDRRFSQWIDHYEKLDATDKASDVRVLLKEIQDGRLPF